METIYLKVNKQLKPEYIGGPGQLKYTYINGVLVEHIGWPLTGEGVILKLTKEENIDLLPIINDIMRLFYDVFDMRIVDITIDVSRDLIDFTPYPLKKWNTIGLYKIPKFRVKRFGTKLYK